VRVSARVSIPSIPGTLLSSSQCGSPSCARQLAVSGESSRIASPAHATRLASRSSGLTPTLPIWVAVITTIWPQYDGSEMIS
jgi:hypothetical protein